MGKIKKYSCGNGDGMFEDSKNGNWIEYKEVNELMKIIQITYDMCNKKTFPRENELLDLKKMCYNKINGK